MSHSLRDYGVMIADEVRAHAYAQALREAIRPGDVVLDLGAGTGLFSLLACRFGARRVYSCDSNPAIQVARELVSRNNLSDRVTCYETRSEKLVLPEPVDVIVSDLRGVLPLHGRHLPTLIDARTRHLKAGGTLLPQADSLWLSLAEAPDEHRSAVTPWGANDFRFDLSPWSALLANSWISARARSAQLVSPPVLWAEIDYRRVMSPNIHGQALCSVTRPATVHGLFVWFDATIAEGVGFTGGPDAPPMPYGCAFLPWLTPVTVSAGETIPVDISAELVGHDYHWTWQANVREVRIKQATFFGACIPADTLRRREAQHVTDLSEDGQVTLQVLDGLARRRSIGQVADELLSKFPRRFASEAECLGFVGGLSVRYGLRGSSGGFSGPPR